MRAQLPHAMSSLLAPAAEPNDRQVRRAKLVVGTVDYRCAAHSSTAGQPSSFSAAFPS